MPELPEVETTKEGIRPHLEGQVIHIINHFGIGFQLGVLPGFGQPAVDKIVEQFRVVLAPHELPRNVRKTGKRGI